MCEGFNLQQEKVVVVVVNRTATAKAMRSHSRTSTIQMGSSNCLVPLFEPATLANVFVTAAVVTRATVVHSVKGMFTDCSRRVLRRRLNHWLNRPNNWRLFGLSFLLG